MTPQQPNLVILHHRQESRDVSGTVSAPEGITNPPIDELLDRTHSKYALVIIAAKRARQINAYYSQLGEGLLEYVGPLVETAPQEKPLSIALREINADLIEFKPTDVAPFKPEASLRDRLTALVSRYDAVLSRLKKGVEVSVYERLELGAWAEQLDAAYAEAAASGTDAEVGTKMTDLAQRREALAGFAKPTSH